MGILLERSWRLLLTVPSLGRRKVVKKRVLRKRHRSVESLLETLLLHPAING